MQFDFIGMQNLYLSLARQDARPLARALRQRPAISPESQWATFVRNHDELTLDKLSDGRARRRCSPPSGPTRTCSCTAAACGAGCRPCSTVTRGGSGWSTACCSPCPARRCSSTARRSGWARTSTSTDGSPYARRCSGPTSATAASPTPAPSRLPRPVIEGAFGPEHVNVAAQRTDPDSLLAFIALLIQALPGVARSSGWADFSVLDQPHRHVLAHECALGRPAHRRGAQPEPRQLHRCR